MSNDTKLPDREARLRGALDAADVGVWEWTIPTGEVAWTDTLERIHGFGRGSFGGTFDVYSSCIHEDDREAVLGAIRRAVEQRSTYEVEYRMYRPDGSIHWVSARGRVFADESGRPRMMMGICMDVSERRRTTEALRLLLDASSTLASSLDYQKTLATVANLCVPHLADWCVIDVLLEDGRLERVAVVHRDPEKVSLVHELQAKYPAPPDAPNGPQRVVRTGVSEFVPDIPLDLLRANARDEAHLATLMALGMRSYICLPLLARGRTLGAITLINAESRRAHDTHDLRVAEELAARAALAIDNARLYERSVEASRAKDEFLATLSHELKTPLTAVLGYASLLEKGDLDPEETRSALEAIKSAAKAQARLVEDILEISRQVLGKVRLDVTPTNLVGVLREAADTLLPAARARGVQLRIECSAPECLVLADPSRVQQILWNLVSNALKFTPEGGSVTLTVATRDGFATIEVRDTGAGIPSQFLPHVFERFTQGPGRRDQGGLGLGLAIARHLVELHGGSIEAHSEGEGKGATFTVRLPLLRDPAASAPREPGRHSHAGT
ncbi:MAG TPA: PAS domain-containing sensor histidine kinase [Thermoanaerobaculia bacterium]|nr:PAS domain-containing sensor histidine kinase [Thermoanaerobaculia bacterium]